MQPTAPGTGLPLPSAEAFGHALCPRSPRHRALRQLHAALWSCDPDAVLLSRVAGLEELFGYLRSRSSAPQLEGAERERAELVRLRLLLKALETFPALRARLSRVVTTVLSEGVGGGLFGRLGIPTDRSFLAETSMPSTNGARCREPSS